MAAEESEYSDESDFSDSSDGSGAGGLKKAPASVVRQGPEKESVMVCVLLHCHFDRCARYADHIDAGVDADGAVAALKGNAASGDVEYFD